MKNRNKLFALVAGLVIGATLLCHGEYPVGQTLFTPGHTEALGILPARGVGTYTPWRGTNLNNFVGMTFTGGNNQAYLVVQAGSNTACPTDLVGTNLPDGTTIVRPVWGTSRPRQGLAVYNCSTSDVFLAIDATAVVDKGIYLAPNSGKFEASANPPQGYITAISRTTNSVITAIEW